MGFNVSPNGPMACYGSETEFMTLWFLANGASNPTSFGGPFITSVVHTATGLYTITLVGYNPRAILVADVYGFDNANADDTDCTIGAVTITAATKTVTVRVATRTAAGVTKDIAANAASIVKLGLVFKVLAGKDASGL